MMDEHNLMSDMDVDLPQTAPETEAPAAVAEAPAPSASVRTVELGQIAASSASPGRGSLDLILDVQLDATVELGRSRLTIREILGLGPGSVVELDKLAGEPADLLVNGKLLARGEIVVIDDDFGIRITEILTPTERLNSLR